MTKILVIEDDPSMIVALTEAFDQEGYEVEVGRDGAEGLAKALASPPSLVVLDLMLPKMSGHDVCRRLRENGRNLPIIMLTARGQEVDKVLGLKLGADDYVTKPFGLSELMARVEAVLRRSGNKPSSQDKYYIGSACFSVTTGELQQGGQVFELSARELRLLRYLLEHRGEIVTRDDLLDNVWDYNEVPLTRTVDVHVSKLRKKLEEDPHNPKYLVTVHGMGYKLKCEH